jgi:hypothetical protein
VAGVKRITGYLSTVWGGITYTRTLELQLDAERDHSRELDDQILILHKALKRAEIAGDPARARARISDLEERLESLAEQYNLLHEAHCDLEAFIDDDLVDAALAAMCDEVEGEGS